MTVPIQRLHRWAEHLGLSESIPINKSEVPDVADWFAGMNKMRNKSTLREAAEIIADQIERGKQSFMGHEIVVLADRAGEPKQ